MADDNAVDIKIAVDASEVAPAFGSATTAAETFLSTVGNTSTELLAADRAESGAAEQMDLFAVETAKASEQLSLFNEAGAVIAPALDTVSVASNAAGTSLSSFPAIFSNIIPWFSRMGTSAMEMAVRIKEAVAESSESISGFAERVRFSATGVNSSFSLIGKAFAGVAIVSVLAETLEKLQENVIETEHLATATGLTVVQYTELTDTMKAMGAPTEGLGRNLTQLASNMEMAREGGKRQAEAFRQLGINTSNWHQQLPPLNEVLDQMASHLSKSTNEVQDLADVKTVAGRSSATLTAFLKTEGTELESDTEKHKAHAEAMEHAVTAALQLRAAEAQFSEQIQTIAVDALPVVVTALGALEIAFRALLIPIKESLDLIIGLGFEAFNLFSTTAKLAIDLVKRDWTSMASDVSAGSDQMKATFNEFTKETREDWQSSIADIKSTWDRMTLAPKEIKPTGSDNITPDFSDHGAQERAQEASLKGQMDHQVRVLEVIRKGYEEQEALGQIDADHNLTRITQTNDLIVAYQKKFYDEMIALAAQDPTHPDKVAELQNERQAAIDKGTQANVAAEARALNEKKKLEDQERASFQGMLSFEAEQAQKTANVLANIFTKEAVAQEEADKKAVADSIRASNEKARGEEQHFSNLQQLYRQDVEFQASLGIISAQQKDQLLAESFKREEDAQKESYQKQLANLDAFDAQYASKKQTLENQLQALEDKEAGREQKAREDSLKKFVNSFNSYMNQIGNAFTSSVQSWVGGTKTFSAAFADMGKKMLSDTIGTLLQIGVKHAEAEALKLALHIRSWLQQKTVDSAAQAESIAKSAATATAIAATQKTIAAAAQSETVATSAATAAAEIANAAGVAAANAFAATAAIPIVGPELAPGVAAGAAATVLGFESFASFDHGGLANEDMLSMVHKDEMVLPVNLSSGLQDLIEKNQTQSHQSQSGPRAGELAGTQNISNQSFASANSTNSVQTLQSSQVSTALQNNFSTIGGENNPLAAPSQISLPSEFSRGLADLVGKSSSPDISGGDNHFHFAPQVHAMDAAGVDRVLDKHQRVFTRRMRQWARAGAFN